MVPLLIALAVALATPATASAATAQVVHGDGKDGSVQLVSFSAAPGETNVVTIGGGTISDTLNPVTPGPGCTAVDATTVTCDAPRARAVRVTLLDEDDEVTSEVALQLEAGSGDDVIEGGIGNDVVDGGPGTDVLITGGGRDLLRDGDGATPAVDRYEGGDDADTVSYASSPLDLTVDLATDRGGPAAAVDELIAIENANGGSGRDRLLGDDGPNLLDGGAGADHVDGLAGDDTLVDDPTSGRGARDLVLGGAGNDVITLWRGRDRVRAGDGNDTIQPTRGTAARIACGSGRDDLNGPTRASLLLPDCERVLLDVLFDDVEVPYSARVRRLRRGRVGLRVDCWKATSRRGRCPGTLVMRRGGPRGRLLGRKRFSLRGAGGRPSLKVPRRIRRVWVKVTLTDFEGDARPYRFSYAFATLLG